MTETIGTLAPDGLSDDELVDLTQRRTLAYFWDYGHPVSGMARERDNAAFGYTPDDTVTTGGTGFGLMALIAGAARGFLDKGAVMDRIATIVTFLERADRFNGVYPHFMNGRTGRVIPFSSRDDGADIVETSFLMAGLITARQWVAAERPPLVAAIDALWREVDWAFHVRPSDKALLWHWSPNYAWAMNHAVTGWNECLITHVLAASSPTHAVDPATYHQSWARGRDFANGRSYDGVRLPLGPDKGGPLFFTHYSFLGLDPRGLVDGYADYFEQNLAHARINHAHCQANPHGYAGYGGGAWGLTASDNFEGYNAHSPTNDLGVLTPTAALSSFPYMPELSMAALRHFSTAMDGRLLGRFGFADSYCPQRNWVAESHLAIDQGPIVVMIENWRSGLIWRLFMSAPEVLAGLDRLGFTTPCQRTPMVA